MSAITHARILGQSQDRAHINQYIVVNRNSWTVTESISLDVTCVQEVYEVYKSMLLKKMWYQHICAAISFLKTKV